MAYTYSTTRRTAALAMMPAGATKTAVTIDLDALGAELQAAYDTALVITEQEATALDAELMDWAERLSLAVR